MVQLRSIIKPADNCGARSVQVVHIYKGSFHKKATIGDIVLAVVKDAIPGGMVKKKEKVKMVIVRTKKEFRR
ncbi:MAG TPA: uL14 family ribosomal protein, partial [Patescibacteria group bacterium]